MTRVGLVLAAFAAVAAAAASCGGSSNGSKAGGDAGSSGGSGGGSGGSGGSSGAGSGGSSGGSSSSSGSGSSSGSSSGGDGGGACLGASLLAAMGKTHLVLGGSMSSATAAAAPFDLQYDYISGGLAPGSGPCTSCATGCGASWWGCGWQYDMDPPGAYVRELATSCAQESPPQIPMVTYYQLLQSSGVAEGAAEVTQAATDATFMSRYFADWRFLLQQVGQSVFLLHIEPDFWGYAEQIGTAATSLPAAVASANSMDCSSMPNTIAGMGQCMISMVRTYAPHALVALHASAWSTNVDVSLNTSTTLDVAGEAQKTAAFLAACGGTQADYVVVETSDRDAGYYQCVKNRDTWWDDTNTTLPTFHQDFAWVTALTEALGKPALYWQTPLGNMIVPNVCPEPDAGTITWHDNRVDYFLANMGELAAAHAVGAAFGAGQGDQTMPETDGNNLVTKAKAYYAAGGQSLCP
jgi:hypothetical protein